MKKLFCILLLIVMCLGLVSCGEKDYSDKTVYYSVTDGINSFDPQLAKTNAEINIASNCFEGLTTKDKDGKIVLGCASSYTVSDDKLTYKFNVKDDLMWSDGETKLKAKDFEFGIKRAVKKSTNAPFASLLYCIKNAEKINKGKMSLSSLGVKADKNTLTIQLEKPSEYLLEFLSQPVCAPCNEEFFNETIGKYGLDNKKIITNGAFYITSFDQKENTVSIYNNQNYSGNQKAKIKSVTINLKKDYKDIYKSFENKDIDVAPIECSYIKSLKNYGNKTKLYYNTNYCLYIPKSAFSAGLRKGLFTSIDEDSIENNISDSYLSPKGIVPLNNTFDNKNYRDTVGVVSLSKYDKKKALKLLGDYDLASKKLSEVKLVYPDTDEKLKLISNLIVQGWQKDLNIYINSEPSSEYDIKEGLKNKEIKIAVIPVSGKGNLATESFLTLKDYGVINYSVKNFNANKLLKVEKSLAKNGVIYPIIAIPNAISYAKDINNLVTSLDGVTIDFRFITKD